MSSVSWLHGAEDTTICGPSHDVLGVMGWRVGNQRPRLWRTSHSGGWTGERRRPIVKAIGSKTVARQTGQTPHSTTKTITEEEETP